MSSIRPLLPPAGLLCLIVALVLLLLLGSAGAPRAQPAQAVHAGGADNFSLDMDPTATPANTNASVGSLETCARVNENNGLDADEDAVDTLRIDVVTEPLGIPASNRMIGFAFTLNYPLGSIEVSAENQGFLLTRLAGSGLFPGLSDPLPDGDGAFNSSALDTSPPPATSESGPGTLSRVDIRTTATAATGVFPLTLTDAAHLDTNNAAFVPDNLKGASVAINTPCPGAAQEADVKVTAVSVTAPASGDVGTPFSVSATATLHNNGPVTPVNVDTTFTLSLPPDCTTASANPQSVAGTSVPQSVATATAAVTWSLTCTSPSAHALPVQAAAAPQAPVTDPTAGNESAQGQASTNVLATTDVKVAGVSVTAPASAVAGAPFSVSLTATLHNNGPITPATADASLDLTVPADCTRVPASAQTAGLSLVQSTPLPVDKTWSVTCTNLSAHTFNGSASLSLAQLHVSDPTANNSGAGQGSTSILAAAADVKVTGVTVSAPATAPVGANFGVTVNTTVHNNGPFFPVNADTTVTLNLPSDCFTPVKTVIFPGASLGPSITAMLPQLTFFVACIGHSFHDITATAVIVLNDPSAGDPQLGNNSLTSAASTTAVIRTADLKVTSVSLTAPAAADTNTAFSVTVDASLHDNGPDPAPADATVTLAVPPDCSAPNNPRTVGLSLPVSVATALPSQTFSVTCTSSSFHDFGATVGLSGPLHVSDPVPGNNSGATLGPTTIPIFDVADLKMSSVSVSGPAQGVVGTPFGVTATLTVHSNGPFAPANADVSATLNLPPDCTTGDPNPQTAQDVSAAASVNSPANVTWLVTCTDKSSHTFSAGGSVALDQLHVRDANGGNDSAQSAGTTLPVVALADGKIASATLLNAPVFIIPNTNVSITVRKVLHNNGPFAPASFNLSKSVVPPAGCTVTPPALSSHTLASSVPVTVDEVWVINCVPGGPYSFDFRNTLSVTGLHVSDGNAANNTASTRLTVQIDSDGDGLADNLETVCGSLPNNATSIPERIDGAFAGVDDDKDTLIDEPLPPGAVGSDCDRDGYTGTAENRVYAPSTRGDQDPCGTAPDAMPFNVPIGWPADLKGGGIPDSTNRINIGDIVSFIAPVRYLGTNVGTNPGDARWDVVPGKGPLLVDINVQDLSSVTVVAPPMLGMVRAFSGPACPFPP